MKRVLVRIPATTANLGPGFDCLGLALRLYNDVEIESRPPGVVEVEVVGEGKGALPEDERNLVCRAVGAVGRRARGRRRGGALPGMRVRCVNRIPVARGLGSSAAAIVGGLVAGARFLGLALPPHEILDAALSFEPHPDNLTAALFGGLTVSAKNGIELECVRLRAPAGLRVAAVIPDRPVLTREARRVLPRRVPLRDAVANLSNTAVLVGALAVGDVALARLVMRDRLHQPYRERVVPGLRAALREAERRGIPGVALSGSGSTVVAFGGRDVARTGELLRRAMARAGVRAEVRVLRPAAHGALEGT